jgi:Cytidine deaminase
MDDYIFPCGICRQVLAEFAGSHMKIICSNKKGDYKVYSFENLLPNAFIDMGGK